ncbi:MAG: AAA family ATPase, partial [Bacteroidales bacterium]|nr:AAA family ATPase [Bacteroidales bacterium]
DEIEKAHPDVFNVLLQVLDDGRLTDNKGRTVDFKNTILIMTSNLGSEVIQGYMEKISAMDNGLNREETLDECRNRVVDILKQSVRPEFVNRIDEIIMFEPLSKKDILGILNLQLDELSRKMAENDIHLTYTQSFVDYLSDKGFDPAYGARPIKRILQRELVNLLAKALIDGTVVKGQQVTVDVDSGNIVLK